MRKGLLIAVVVLLFAASAAEAAPRKVVVGIGDQKASMFTDPRLGWLGVRHARLVVPWYVGSGTNAEELAYVDAWLRAARKAGVEPLVGFGHGFSGWTRIYLPKQAEYERAVRQFRKRWPWVTRFIAWNEANHCSQPTCRKPERAAQYFDTVKRVCAACTVVAADVIDQPNMTSWLRRFRRAAKREPTIYGLHNYLDVNRLRTQGTRRLVKAVPKGARIWITETGGVVRRKHFRSKASFPENAAHAGKVTAFALRTARSFPRIDRLYLYHWNSDRADATWDSGLIDPAGLPRPGFVALATALGRDPLKTPVLVPKLPVPVPVPTPPPSGPAPSDPQQPAPPPADPPPTDCGILQPLCDPFRAVGLLP